MQNNYTVTFISCLFRKQSELFTRGAGAKGCDHLIMRREGGGVGAWKTFTIHMFTWTVENKKCDLKDGEKKIYSLRLTPIQTRIHPKIKINTLVWPM